MWDCCLQSLGRIFVSHQFNTGAENEGKGHSRVSSHRGEPGHPRPCPSPCSSCLPLTLCYGAIGRWISSPGAQNLLVLEASKPGGQALPLGRTLCQTGREPRLLARALLLSTKNRCPEGVPGGQLQEDPSCSSALVPAVSSVPMTEFGTK